MTTYSFRYSAIAEGLLQNVDSSGGLYGSDSNNYSGTDGTEKGTSTDISSEITNLHTLWGNINNNVLGGDSVLAKPGIYNDTTVWYELTSGLNGTITLLSYDPTAVFYLYGTVTTNTDQPILDLSKLSIVCAGNLQTYNVYILSNYEILLGNSYAGNIIAGSITCQNDVYVDGSITALNIKTSGVYSGGIIFSNSTISVRMGCPRYTSSYAAIAPSISSSEINGGKYGITNSLPFSITGTSVLDTQSNAATELEHVQSFMNDALTFLYYNSIYTYVMINVTTQTSVTLYPISRNIYYIMTGTATSTSVVITFTFRAYSSSDVFYITSSTSDMDLRYVVMNTSEYNANVKNIYFINQAGKSYLSINNIGGTFMANNEIYGTSNIDAVFGTLSGSVYSTTSTIQFPIINFTGSNLSYTRDFTYSAIAYSDMENITVKGGLYGSETGTTSVTAQGGALPGSTIEDELTALGTLWTNIYNDLMNTPPFYCLDGDFTYSNPLVWYEIKTNISGTITFSSDDPDARFYLYVSVTPINLSNLSILVSGSVQYTNIYILSGGTVTLGPNDYYGNFLVGDIRGAESTRVVGTVSALKIGDSTGTMSTFSTVFTTPCFMEGTKILTDQWYVPIEQLKVGDHVMVYGELHDKIHCVDDVKPMPILKIQKHVRCATSRTSPIVFTKHALGINCPFEDLHVSPNHRIVDRKGRLSAANKFVNNSTIFQDPTIDRITYYHLELACHCTVRANGVLTETYNNPLSKGKRQHTNTHDA